jgi:hypothetical protein
MTCTATHTFTQAELNANGSPTPGSGILYNVVTGSSTGAPDATDNLSIPITQRPGLTITKTATPTVYDHIGQVISYSFRVENTGNVTLTGPFLVADNKATVTCTQPADGALSPNETMSCTASYTILRGDMTSGSVTNTAYATGKFGGTTITSNTDSETVRAKQTLTYTFLPTVNLSRYGVHVLPNSFYYESHDIMFIIGEVVNNTSDTLTWVDVAINLFDSGGGFVDASHTYMWPLDLPAWKKGCFKIYMDVPPNWSYYQFEIPTYYTSDTSSGLTIFNDSGLYKSYNGDYEILGQVRNDGNQPSNSVGVSGTLYNASGVPVGCERASINSSDLNPGQISSFAINFLGYYRSYNDVSYYRLRVAGDLP